MVNIPQDVLTPNMNTVVDEMAARVAALTKENVVLSTLLRQSYDALQAQATEATAPGGTIEA